MAQHTLEMITETVGYFPGSVNIGFVQGKTGAILIDSGLDTQTAKKIKKGLDAIAQPLSAIVQTHAHADHFGGNAYLLSCWPAAQVYAPPLEEAIIRYPLLEPIYLGMGAQPLDELRNKFLLAEASRVDHLLPTEGRVEIDETCFEVIPLPGHSWNQVGLVVDRICFSADSYLGEETLKKHKLPFLVDAHETLLSLVKLLESNYRGYLPGHGPYTTTPEAVLTQNIHCHRRLYGMIEEILSEERTLEQALALVCERLQISIENATSYVLYRTALMGYFIGLLKEERIRYRFAANQWLWGKHDGLDR
ncbi:MBL fold metallo-hydrolase [Brevibacillus borstelensis]|jgi:glyoxylase-like metal-dependent hydrolase (beta-lactamase superfamily II)|uniref:MBL fold metallo-hydrolase n=1 Tax=Brevibacillus TaxID=55080 RepID=UPI00046AE13D|nr:MBL fold metallo-hydrolase [Brevibacillus borstelensis]MCM3471927.1 MBL fold metallo-hydrolase [Brevibacillus borstelensis]MCM3559777.1 MBL fold metallo-hydrolase [Brevibacillus borstelensis]MCM3592081.1 MBL fold metallo-hydrolase [Brevibacillus borstelensis]MCM3624045.1 MBL fold metallo-hydrolase [Brevibacillus borstelensis]MED1853484.1 MBL fold metallo-hydrolase [Brevibacillus borstelensis]